MKSFAESVVAAVFAVPYLFLLFGMIATSMAVAAATETSAAPGAGWLPTAPAPHHFKVGAADCWVLYDTQNDYPPASFFANAPPEELARVLREHREIDATIYTPYAALLVRTPSNTVLIDTGARSFVGDANSHLLANLAAAGVAPEQIDTVLLTHAHLDHIGGTLGVDGQPAFPRARFVMFKQEWDFWMQEKPDLSAISLSEKKRQFFVDVAHRQLNPLRDRMELVDRDTEVRPGVTALLAPGHTPGHMLVRLESGGQKLLYVADLVLNPLALEYPNWHSQYEVDIALSQATKHRFLQLAADEQMLVYAMHFPWPGLGQVVPTAGHWTWQPVAASPAQ